MLSSCKNLAEIAASGISAARMQPAESARYKLCLCHGWQAEKVSCNLFLADCRSVGCAYPLLNWSPSSTTKVSPKYLKDATAWIHKAHYLLPDRLRTLLRSPPGSPDGHERHGSLCQSLPPERLCQECHPSDLAADGELFPRTGLLK